MAKLGNTLLTLFAGVIACTGCAGQGTASSKGQDLGGYQVVAALTGKLVLKGNMPMFQPVLIQDSGQQWELLGVSKEQSEALQNKVVQVEGTPGPAGNVGSLRRTFNVRKLTTL